MLAQDEDMLVRSNVAENTHSSPKVLSGLAEDELTVTRVAVAENPNTPYNTLVMLSKDEELCVSKKAEEALKKHRDKSKISIEK